MILVVGQFKELGFQAFSFNGKMIECYTFFKTKAIYLF
jgi:hypothetical protein